MAAGKRINNKISRSPLVSIGMAVYNEEPYIEKTINSLLIQTYSSFELIISDNASSDKTGEICRKIAAKDNRIRYSRNNTNIGSLANFNKVMQLAEGKYFMWASGHDIWDKSYLEKAVRLLEKRKDCVICHAQSKKISREGKALGLVLEGISIENDAPYGRVKAILSQLSYRPPNAIYGLIRRDSLKKIRPVKKTFGSDHINLIELAYWGKIIMIEEPLYSSRLTHSGDIEKLKKAYKRYYPDSKGFRLTYTRLLLNYLNTINYLPFSWTEKWKLYLLVALVFARKRLWMAIVNDFLRFFIGEKNIYWLREAKNRFFKKKSV